MWSLLVVKRTGVQLLLLSVVFLVSATWSPLPADDKEQIADLEKKLSDLQKQLAEMKKQQPAAPANNKKPLAIKDADTWRSVRAAVLSPDGKWFAPSCGTKRR